MAESARMEKLMLVDGNALVHRAYHALPPLTSPKGEIVGAVFGFASAFLRSLQDEKPDYVVVCWDAGRLTFRNEIYDGYKAKRKETDEALVNQLPRVYELLETMSVPQYKQKGVEADDLIGSLARISKEKGLKTVIVTGDNDALQLVNDTTYVYALHRGMNDSFTFDRPVVKAKIGVYPEQIVDYKSLAGDNSDNIPGVPGVGPKTAIELLDKYQTLDGILAHLEELPDRPKKLITENKEMALTSQQLATIKKDIEVKLNLAEARTSSFDFSRALGLFQELGFKSLIHRLGQTAQIGLDFGEHKEISDSSSAQASKIKTEVVATPEQLDNLVKRIEKLEFLAVDTETVDLGGPIIGLSLAWTPSEAVYIPVAPAYEGGLTVEQLQPLAQILADSRVKKIGHNIKYDLKTFLAAGMELNGIWFDTMVAAGLIQSQSQLSLDDLALSELGIKMIPLTDLIGPKKQEPMNSVELTKLAEYAGEDAAVTWQLFKKQQPLMEEAHLKTLFYQMEMPLLPILVQMEADGVMVDVDRLKNLSGVLSKQLDSIKNQAAKLVGSEVNLASPTQLKEVLFTKLAISTAGVKKNKTGLSTDAETLGKLKDAHPIIPLILEFREVAKLLNTYVETLPTQTDEQGRIHTTFNQLGSATGRVSSNNPNLQNIPIRTELGNQVRRCFIAPKGKVLLAGDYSQAELRVLAHLSGDQALIEAFAAGQDFHASVAERLGVDRRTAKAINFGIVYGLGAIGLANDLDTQVATARSFIDRYFETFPGVAEFIKQAKVTAREKGYAETVFGRRRYLPDLNSGNQMMRAMAERIAVNMPAQGTVADLMKRAMVNLQPRLPEGTKMLLQIHDELLLEVNTDQVESVAKLLKEVMTEAGSLKLPLVVETKTGDNWADLKPLA